MIALDLLADENQPSDEEETPNADSKEESINYHKR